MKSGYVKKGMVFRKPDDTIEFFVTDVRKKEKIIEVIILWHGDDVDDPDIAFGKTYGNSYWDSKNNAVFQDSPRVDTKKAKQRLIPFMFKYKMRKN